MQGVVDLLKALRSKGLTQTEINRRTGVPQPRISRWESGDVPAAASDVLKLQQLLAELDAEGALPIASVSGMSAQVAANAT